MVWALGLAGWMMMKCWLLPYSKAMETLTLPVSECEHSPWGAAVCSISRTTQLCGTAPWGLWSGGSTSGTSVPHALGESTVWAQPAKFTPFAYCPLSVWVPYNANFFSLTLYFRRPPIPSRDFSGVLKTITLNQGIPFWASDWISKCCFPVPAVLWACCLCSLPSLAAELSLFFSEADMVYHSIFHISYFLFHISSSCLLRVAYTGLVFFSVTAFIVWPLMEA